MNKTKNNTYIWYSRRAILSVKRLQYPSITTKTSSKFCSLITCSAWNKWDQKNKKKLMYAPLIDERSLMYLVSGTNKETTLHEKEHDPDDQVGWAARYLHELVSISSGVVCGVWLSLIHRGQTKPSTSMFALYSFQEQRSASSPSLPLLHQWLYCKSSCSLLTVPRWYYKL